MMFDSNYDLKDESETLRLAESMASHLFPGMNLYLKGELGSGKTTFVRGALRGLGYQDKVKSPTYTLVEPYSLEKFTIYHFDLYRFKDETEWDDAGFREYFNNTSICLVEWPEKVGHILPKPDISIELSHTAYGRHLHLISYTSIGTECLKAII
ncbi:tRNA (adenosine(37)-N6)-threonylcarbamoyltransferase complex ATPase subunit type 1 TsaE [Candidatus Methylopumilus rimovensis]|uniref:tRNA (adenosine(37)-N6)-threonylcarbamoyltransferase complex ATPase subunit type 1 TsaE n=1 Tax=Candidatus Methylopumilus rimovensis TaxID=2588535 RepID=UPI001121F6FC|nr:tRNA (adenosine(37)-N6)-threonylcarbamoyltransferase complex ATPase subunit type 1 TsaE [Candidatus Methylopumilus rimovensis]QDD12151.1 tRNA (adenosine(37)-N6)-threonylcarbamoyltransferase complex ATPase subunit type 1 TsaE [Candidatus Methylopumilus rimovensis]